VFLWHTLFYHHLSKNQGLVFGRFKECDFDGGGGDPGVLEAAFSGFHSLEREQFVGFEPEASDLVHWDFGAGARADFFDGALNQPFIPPAGDVQQAGAGLVTDFPLLSRLWRR